MDNTKKIQELLAMPFGPEDIEWRVQQAGYTKDGSRIWAQVLAYVTNRAIQERLDDVVGIDRWKNGYSTAPDGGTLCGISIKFDEWITKYDGAENTQIEAVKGGLSGSMKRAGVQWGIGRYLYNLEPVFVTGVKEKPDDTGEWIRTSAKLKKDDKYATTFYYKIPTLPKWALPNVAEAANESTTKRTTA